MFKLKQRIRCVNVLPPSPLELGGCYRVAEIKGSTIKVCLLDGSQKSKHRTTFFDASLFKPIPNEYPYPLGSKVVVVSNPPYYDISNQFRMGVVNLYNTYTIIGYDYSYDVLRIITETGRMLFIHMDAVKLPNKSKLPSFL